MTKKTKSVPVLHPRASPDGHDRLQAAIAEGVRPRAICLWQALVEPITDLDGWRAEVVRTYQRAFEAEDQLSLDSRQQLNGTLVRSARAYRRAQTRAVARPGLEVQWAAQVREQLQGEPALCERVLG